MSRQRWTDAETGAPALAGGLPDSLDGIDNPVIRMYHAYYKTDRGYHAALGELERRLDRHQPRCRS